MSEDLVNDIKEAVSVINDPHMGISIVEMGIVQDITVDGDQAEIILKSTVEQAQNQANIILSEAEYSANGIIKQAEKLAELREKKSISDTEKQYERAIKLVLEEIVK